eukprot:6280048-Prymnesium_polylepis.2
MLTRVVSADKDKFTLRDLCEHEHAAMSEQGRMCDLPIRELKNGIRAYRARPYRTGCRRCTAKRESV